MEPKSPMVRLVCGPLAAFWPSVVTGTWRTCHNDPPWLRSRRNKQGYPQCSDGNLDGWCYASLHGLHKSVRSRSPTLPLQIKNFSHSPLDWSSSPFFRLKMLSSQSMLKFGFGASLLLMISSGHSRRLQVSLVQHRADHRRTRWVSIEMFTIRQSSQLVLCRKQSKRQRRQEVPRRKSRHVLFVAVATRRNFNFLHCTSMYLLRNTMTGNYSEIRVDEANVSNFHPSVGDWTTPAFWSTPRVSSNTSLLTTVVEVFCPFSFRGIAVAPCWVPCPFCKGGRWSWTHRTPDHHCLTSSALYSKWSSITFKDSTSLEGDVKESILSCSLPWNSCNRSGCCTDFEAAMVQLGQGVGTLPIKRTSPLSTYGFVVNHSHMKALVSNSGNWFTPLRRLANVSFTLSDQSSFGWV